MSAKPLLQLERLINRVLFLDPTLSSSLSELSGRVISLEFIKTNMIIYVKPGYDGLHLSDEHEGAVDVRIRATPSDMLAYLVTSREGNGKFAGSLEIIGDVGLAQQFQTIMKDVELDWEEQISHWVGDTAAHKLGRFAKHTFRFLRESKQTLELDMSEYLRYEKEILPVKSEVNEFINSVDSLRDDVERMKLRIDRLQQRILTGF